MSILLLGAEGQVGFELRRSLCPLGEVVTSSRSSLDLEDASAVSALLAQVRPRCIVNAAAYTAVDQAETEKTRASAMNARLPSLLALEAKRMGAFLVHYSTDYVFDGTQSTPYLETDTPAPLNHYGRSKLEGELGILESGCEALIFRTSWVYSLRGRNFLLTMLKLARTRESLKVVSDQIGSPTSAEWIADMTAFCLQKALTQGQRGLYHLTAKNHTSWHDYAQTIVSGLSERGHPLKLRRENIIPIPSSEYPTPAKRPLNSRLGTTRIAEDFSVSIPPFEWHLERALSQLSSLWSFLEA